MHYGADILIESPVRPLPGQAQHSSIAKAVIMNNLAASVTPVISKEAINKSEVEKQNASSGTLAPTPPKAHGRALQNVLNSQYPLSDGLGVSSYGSKGGSVPSSVPGSPRL